MKSKGFTLIELLVVIAIIGILASVVLASLNSARSKGADAAIKAGLANTRAQAELFYNDNGNSYQAVKGTAKDVCATAADTATTKGISGMLSAAAKTAGVANGTINVDGPSSDTSAVCAANANAWAATVPLKNPTITGNVYCVDSTGFAGEVAGNAIHADNKTVCN